MAPPPYPLHPDVSQPGSFCLRAVSQQNICKSMCGNWKSPVYNSWSPFSFLTNVITRRRKYFEKDEPIGIQAWKSKKIWYNPWNSSLFSQMSPQWAWNHLLLPKWVNRKPLVTRFSQFLIIWLLGRRTIWLFDDYLTIWSPDGASYSRVRREGRLIILVTDWPLAYSATNIIFVPCVFLHIWTFDSPDDWLTDPPSPSVTQEFNNYCDDWRHKVCTWPLFVLKDESANDVGGCEDIWNSVRVFISWLLSKLMLTIFNEFCCTFRSNWRQH